MIAKGPTTTEIIEPVARVALVASQRGPDGGRARGFERKKRMERAPGSPV
jgi:hypothetical protein